METKEEPLVVHKILVVTTQHVLKTNDPQIQEDFSFCSSVLLNSAKPIIVDSSGTTDITLDPTVLNQRNYPSSLDNSIILRPTFSKKIQGDELNDITKLSGEIVTTACLKELQAASKREVDLLKEIEDRNHEKKILQKRKASCLVHVQTCGRVKKIFERLADRVPRSIDIPCATSSINTSNGEGVLIEDFCLPSSYYLVPKI